MSTTLKRLSRGKCIAIVGLLSAMLLYYFMLMLDGGVDTHIILFSIEFIVGIPIMVYFFFGENWIKNVKKKVAFANVQAFLIASLIGVGFFFQLPAIKNVSIKLTAFSLVIGVVGAAAFTFACNRFTFLLFSLPWLLPVTFFFFFFAGDLGSVSLGGMVVPYVGVLTFLCLKDYTRRVELIRSELSLVEEKEQVVAASQKLQTSLDLVNKLKQQQDGDYYLTSLLLNPLGVNAADEGFNVDVDFFTKQKKAFEFKSHKRNIGGDISIAHTLHFETGPVTVFLNADAMGKSMQGAGGALVLGAVFQSIIERTRLLKNLTPENWLADVFLELQKVFESFDCSMLISVYFALLENNTGKLYFLNAEHPWGVLYRNGKAIFLQNRSYYRKLGTPGLQENIQVDQIQLQSGDIILLGSDGRDDIALPGRHETHRVINEDESIFLRHVEAADGRLEEIYKLISASGEITDDLSLVRVQYNAPKEKVSSPEGALSPQITKAHESHDLQINEPNDKQNIDIPLTASTLLREAKQKVDTGKTTEAGALLKQAFESASAGPRALRAALNLAMQIRDYALAIEIAERILPLRSDDAEVLYLAAFAERRLNRLSNAKRYAEKAHQAEGGQHLTTMNLLADIYIELKESANARAMLDEIEPHNETVKKMREALA
ncbi:MAG TPA: SpoIIE family protein phosphatase [Turneriella sp.]|nr:SpoIIE family protein phosphatase [Turneriella sp.]